MRTVQRDPLVAEIAGLPDGAVAVYDVRGAGGVGKSAFLEMLAGRLAERDALTLRVALGRYARSPDAERGDFLTVYRTIVERLARGLPAAIRAPLKSRVREIAAGGAPASGPALAVAQAEITDEFVGALDSLDEELPVALLVDDLSSLPTPLGEWVVDLLQQSVDERPAIVVVTNEARAPELDFEPEPKVLQLGAFTQEDVARMLAEQAPTADAETWRSAIERWCGNYPRAVALAVEVAAESPDRPEALDDASVIAGRDDGLVDALLASLRDDAERSALEVAALARSFDGTLITALVPEDSAAPDLPERIIGLPFVTRAEAEDRYRVAPFVRLLVAERLRGAPRRELYSRAHDRLEELHSELAAFYRAQVDDFEQAQPHYGAWTRFERPETQADLLEFLHHSSQLADGWTWLKVASIYLDAFWWWGVYLESDFCLRVLAAWESVARPGDREMVDALRRFQTSYPPIGRYEDGAWDGRATAPRGAWQEVVHALDVIARGTGLDRGLREVGFPPDELHTRAIIDIFRGEAQRFLDPRDPAAARCFVEAQDIFQGRIKGLRPIEEDAWCVPWVYWERADLELDESRANYDEAERLAHAGLAESRKAPPADHDHEIDANLHRVLGDAQWQRGEQRRAFRHYANAVFSAYAFNVVPDDYTRAFYREITGRTVERVLGLARADRDAAAEVCEALGRLWEPYWQETGHPPEPGCAEALLDAGAEVAVCLFPSPPRDADLGEESAYGATVKRVCAALEPRIAALSQDGFDHESAIDRARGLFRRGPEAPDEPRAPRVEVPAGEAEPAELFEPADDPVWPNYWREFPREWRVAAQAAEREADIRAVVRRAIDELPEGWRTVVERRDLDGWTYEDVARRLAVSRSNQTVILHHARARIRRTLAAYFEGAANGSG